MSQNDFNIANQGHPSFRSDLNSALLALASNSAGTSAPATTYAYMWWYDSTNNTLKMRNADNDAWIDFASFDQATDAWSFASVVIDGDLAVDTDTLVVDSTNGRVGIKQASPSHPLHIGTSDLIVDASGNVLVGKTATNYNNTGVQLFNAGYVHATADGSNVVTVNRKTSDGNLVDFRKDGTTVGSIGTAFTALNIDAQAQGVLRLAGTDKLKWDNHFTPAADNAVNLGGSSTRFKDLYLSGGVYLGGTGAANLLDDYEEGTWTPDVVGTTTAGTGTYAVRTGKYTKIGNLVTVFGSYELTAHTGSGNLRIDGLPFTAANEFNLYTIGHWSSNNLTLDAIAVQVYVFSNPNTDYLTVSQVRNATSNLPVVLDVAHSAWFSISYYV